MAIDSLADSLAAEGGAWARDDDPELVKDATAFGLKTIESLLDAEPEHPKLLLAATRNFTQYAYAFLQQEADYIEERDDERAEVLRQRAGRLYRRAIAYGLRGLSRGQTDYLDRLRSEPERALKELEKEQVGLLYWTAVAWGAAVALDKDDAELASDLSLVDAFLRRALSLDPGYGEGQIHDFMISWEASRPQGSQERAEEHLKKARLLSKEQRTGPLLAYAETLCVKRQDRACFKRQLEAVLAFDVDTALRYRLANRITQRRARWLQAHMDDLFIE